MVLCSLEEAWGDNYTSTNKQQTQQTHNKTYEKDMPPHPQFSRDTRPLKKHHGKKNRVPLKKNIQMNIQQTINDEANMQEQQNLYEEEYQPHSTTSEDMNNYSEVNDEYEDENEEEETNNKQTEEYYDYSGTLVNDDNDDNYGEFNEQEYDETYDDDNEQDEQYTENQDVEEEIIANPRYDSYMGGQGSGEAHVTVNISHLMDKVNKLISHFDKHRKRNGNENQDVFLFVVIGIFIIFIMDLIFRIAVKMTSVAKI
jgi:hypothetical protein